MTPIVDHWIGSSDDEIEDQRLCNRLRKGPSKQPLVSIQENKEGAHDSEDGTTRPQGGVGRLQS